MRTAEVFAEDLLVDHLPFLRYLIIMVGVFECLRFLSGSGCGRASITLMVDLFFDTRWGKVDKLLQSEAPAGKCKSGSWMLEVSVV